MGIMGLFLLMGYAGFVWGFAKIGDPNIGP